jgi:hypothetical protein
MQLKRRRFLTNSAKLAVGVAVVSLVGQNSANASSRSSDEKATATGFAPHQSAYTGYAVHSVDTSYFNQSTI